MSTTRPPTLDYAQPRLTNKLRRPAIIAPFSVIIPASYIALVAIATLYINFTRDGRLWLPVEFMRLGIALTVIAIEIACIFGVSLAIALVIIGAAIIAAICVIGMLSLLPNTVIPWDELTLVWLLVVCGTHFAWYLNMRGKKASIFRN